MLDNGQHRKADRPIRRSLVASPEREDLWQLAAHQAYSVRLSGTAIRFARRSLALDPGFVIARRTLGAAHLLEDDFRHGFAALDAKGRSIQTIPLPLWNGEPLVGHAIAVVGEEGFGDMIQMARFLPMLVGLGAKVTLIVPRELSRLFAGIEGVTTVAAVTPDSFDVWVPLMALPQALGVSRVDGRPYLKAPQVGPDIASSDELSVGISWRGRATHPNDARRSLDRDSLDRLLSTPGVRFVSLDPVSAPPPMLSVPLSDFADTAHLMSQLDLVISVDTSAAHLAGALGVPAWVFLADVPEWRWGVVGSESAWYASLRLYRCDESRDRPAVISAMAADLADLARRRIRERAGRAG